MKAIINNDDRIARVEIAGEEYPMLLSTGATKQIAKKFGGLSELGDRFSALGADESIDELLWLVGVLINQGILYENLRGSGEKRKLLTDEELEVLTTPADLAGFKDAILDALVKGTKREVQSEPEKN